MINTCMIYFTKRRTTGKSIPIHFISGNNLRILKPLIRMEELSHKLTSADKRQTYFNAFAIVFANSHLEKQHVEKSFK